MLKNLQNIFAISCLFLLLPVSSYASNNQTQIKYGYPDQSIFIATVNGKEQPISPMLTVAKELFKRIGIPMTATAYPAKRLFRNLKNGETNFTILVRASSLKDDFIFSKNPIYSTSLNVYYIGDKKPISKKEDLKDTRLVTIRGYSYGSLRKFLNDPKNGIKKETTNRHSSAFEMLKLSRVDYLLDYASAANDIIAENMILNLKSNKINQLDIFLVLSKSYPNANELMKQLETAMQSIDINKILRESGVRFDNN